MVIVLTQRNLGTWKNVRSSMRFSLHPNTSLVDVLPLDLEDIRVEKTEAVKPPAHAEGDTKHAC
jgi:hypothetical protein